MNISTKNTMRTIAIGVMAVSVSSLGGLAFSAPIPEQARICGSTYLQEADNRGKTLAVALDGCYVNRPAGPAVDNCVQNAFQGHYRALLAAIDNYQRCSVAPPTSNP